MANVSLVYTQPTSAGNRSAPCQAETNAGSSSCGCQPWFHQLVLGFQGVSRKCGWFASTSLNEGNPMLTKGEATTNHSEGAGSSSLISGPEYKLSRAALVLEFAPWLLNRKEMISTWRMRVLVNGLLWVGILDCFTSSPCWRCFSLTLTREVL